MSSNQPYIIRNSWIVLAFLGVLWMSTVSTALKCYHCISIECPEGQTQLFCEGLKEYLLSQLPDLYNGYRGQRIPLCPSPEDDDPGWDELQQDTTYQCESNQEGETKCALGRFRITTEIFETGKNITSYGIAMGCSNYVLMSQTKKAVTAGKCDMSTSKSRFKHSLRHYLEIEHCARPPDMCGKEDFCIPPYATRIKKFQDEPKSAPFPFTLVLGIFLVIALAVIVLTFLAPYFNG